jgi:hypothetical protein
MLSSPTSTASSTRSTGYRGSRSRRVRLSRRRALPSS